MPRPAGYVALVEGTTGWLALADIGGPVLAKPVPPQPVPAFQES